MRYGTRYRYAVSVSRHRGGSIEIRLFGPPEVFVDGRPIELTAKEFELLAFFMANAGVVVSRDLLLDRVWGQEYPGGTRTVDVHVAQLRRKLGRPDLIRTFRGAGYKAVA